jgi:hypothetical protein
MRLTEDGLPVHSFRSLLTDLATCDPVWPECAADLADGRVGTVLSFVTLPLWWNAFQALGLG